MNLKKATDKKRSSGLKETKNILLHIVYENDLAEDNETQHLTVFDKCDQAL